MGLLSDVNVVWEDLRVDLQNLVDVGLMAKLWKPEVHADEAFQNLSLEAATSEVFSITIDKGQQKGVLWDQDLKDEDIVCKSELKHVQVPVNSESRRCYRRHCVPATSRNTVRSPRRKGESNRESHPKFVVHV